MEEQRQNIKEVVRETCDQLHGIYSTGGFITSRLKRKMITRKRVADDIKILTAALLARIDQVK